MRRHKMSKRSSRKSFHRTVGSVHRKNLIGGHFMRGGIRL